ncbi:hypothetical protein [Turkeypox virus]|uniref:Uncharacterized protein n=1 Tax=Turkeypox virus TaxID=336486 RepID=A0A0M3ZHN5_9POXV|nr:hypothetical protein ASN15_gp149 [Turkeypox virus]ALA62523.1 hypothetical protein [Turkeypox virus]
MYAPINASQISCLLEDLLPDRYDEDKCIPNKHIVKIQEFIELAICRNYAVIDISDITVLCMDTSNATNKYLLTTDTSSHDICENTGLIIKRFEGFFVVCLDGYCKITVNLGDRQISDTIKESCGFIMDVGLDHLMVADNAVLVVAKYTLDASMFYYQNIIMFPEENLLAEFKGSNFILYDISVNGIKLKLLVTNKNTYNFITGEKCEILKYKYIFDRYNLPMPVIPLSHYEFTSSDMFAIRNLDIDSVIARVRPCIDGYHNNIWLRVVARVLYGVIIT